MDLHDLRSDRSSQEFRRRNLQPDPIKQFQTWFEEAIAEKVYEPNAMTLATSTKEGQPSTRTVLLKQFDEQGFVFFTNYASKKAVEIALNPQVSVTFFWKEMERQVNIQGTVEKTSRTLSEKYFAKRPRKSQLGAAASRQSQVIPNRKTLEDEYQRLENLYEGHDIPCPEMWGGFIIHPFCFEFWQGRPNRIHDRFRYQLNEGQWIIERLSP